MWISLVPLKKDSFKTLSTNSTTAFSSSPDFFALGIFTFKFGLAILGLLVWVVDDDLGSWIASTTDLNFKAWSKLLGLATYNSTLQPVMLLIFPANVDFVGSNKAIFKILPFNSNGNISFSIIKSLGSFLTASFFTVCSVKMIFLSA